MRCGNVHGVPISNEPGEGNEVIEFDCRQVGSALVVCSPAGASKAARVLAAALPADPLRTVVVADFPPDSGPEVWTALVAALRRRGPVRLAVSRAGSGELSSPAQWLADQLKVEVVAPDGVLLPVPGGSAFVIDSHGAGCWFRFRPSHPPEPLGSRFPAPDWEPMTPSKPWASGRAGVAEPIPAGLWMHAMPSVRSGPSREHARPVFALPCRPDVLTVVLGGPDERPVPPDEVRALLTALPVPARTRVRIAPYGVSPLGDAYLGEPLGQVVADLVGEHVVVYSGLPVVGSDGVDIVAYDAQGQPSWRPFTTELGYWPRNRGSASAPSIIGHRPPISGMPTLRPGVYQLAEAAVVELVHSGLWVREPAEPADAVQVRALPMDPLWARITVGVPGQPTSPELFAAATDLYSRLDPDTQRAVRFVFSDAAQLQEDKPVPVAVSAPAPEVAAPAPAPTPEPEPESEPEPEPVAVAAAPAPAAASSAEDEPPRHGRHSDDGPTAVVRAHEMRALTEQSVDQEIDPELDLLVELPEEPEQPPAEVVVEPRSTQADRDWMRHTLGANYDSHAAAVLRMIARHPELRSPQDDSLETVVTELVSAQVYLVAKQQRVDASLRSGDLGQLMPFASCAVSGMRRLAPYGGVVLCWGEYLPQVGAVLTEPAFLNTVSDVDSESGGPVEYLIWSVTGRRVDELGRTQDRVVFLPGAKFRVLAVSGRRVLLAEDGAPGGVLSTMVRTAAVRDALPADRRRRPDARLFARWPVRP
ncbi:hypothetical protein KALB_8122 [Kutzneria albida DSM 43870]|uniref:Uncharacterized protein n=1 Tax=Kutzneria albida DSM 43870 TaxID=1449976 RepID=W5WTI9_9PSEU|nr:hypothetical protein KALB_8122 [Kutzneria albida DSM 43870]